MKWLLLAVLSQGIVPTDITFRNVDDCYKQAGQAALMARNAKAEIAEAKAQDIELNKYACVLMDDLDGVGSGSHYDIGDHYNRS